MQSPLKCRLVNGSGGVHEVLVGRPRSQQLPLLHVLGKPAGGPFWEITSRQVLEGGSKERGSSGKKEGPRKGTGGLARTEHICRIFR